MIKSKSRSPDRFFFSEQAVVDLSSLPVDAECCAQSDRNSDNGEPAIQPGQRFFADDSSDNPIDNTSDIRYSPKPANMYLDTKLGKHKSFHFDRVTLSSGILETIPVASS